MILKEGGNVFKTEPEKELMTQRIATPDVHPTVQFIEKITGMTFDEQDLLGTTGKKVNPDGSFEQNSSGDIDLNTDARKITKGELIGKISTWLKSQGIPEDEIMNKGRKKQDGWIADVGDQVHFRTPIKGNDANGFVQTDFMFTMNPDFQRGAKRGGTEAYGGKYRAMMLASIARGRGYKFSPKFGVVDPENGDKIIADNWNDIAVVLLGQGAKEADTHTVESMVAFIKNDPDYEQLVAGAKEAFEKDGLTLPESNQELDRIKELAGLNLNSVRML
jgi:hypothetical protein